MSHYDETIGGRSCLGPVPFGVSGRRAFLQAGLAGFATLSLPNIL